jgi:hypothetical protein
MTRIELPHRFACGSGDIIRLLYGLLVLGHARRRILWLGATAPPIAEWIARSIDERTVLILAKD